MDEQTQRSPYANGKDRPPVLFAYPRPKVTIGRWFFNQRMKFGRTQRDVATAVGVGVPYLSRIEHGHKLPSRTETITAFAQEYEISSDRLHWFVGRLPDDLADWLFEAGTNGSRIIKLRELMEQDQT